MYKLYIFALFFSKYISQSNKGNNTYKSKGELIF